ncbi:hypothetical protein Pst134EB_006167 [Puccinia striiformis f. sp. tritici]|nr:hypothetical protein Pst134EB_006167 [Puccinia striiformis f. sp. tritici]
MALTESLIAGIILGKGDYKLIGAYVTSPLNWAVITGTNTKYKAITDLKGQKMGISHPGLDLGLAGVIPDSNQMMIPNQLMNTEVAKVTNT